MINDRPGAFRSSPPRRDMERLGRTNLSADKSKQKRKQHSYEEVEAILKKHVQEWKDSYHELVQAWLPRARRAVKEPSFGQDAVNATRSSSQSPPNKRQRSYMHDRSPFLGLSTSRKEPGLKASQQTTGKLSISSMRNGIESRSTINANITTYQDGVDTVPPHSYHVRIQSGLLTENNKKLNYNPTEIECEDPEWSPKVYEKELNESYTHGTPWDRALPLEHAESSKQLRPHIMKALEELQCSISDVLRYILDPNPPTPEKKKVRAKLGLQSQWERWATVLSTLPESTNDAQALALNVCLAFEKVARFNIWFLAKDADIVANKAPEDVPTRFTNYHSLMCRVCFSHLCTAHGEFEEDHETAMIKNGYVETKPGSINYRLSVTSQGPRRPPTEQPEPTYTPEPHKSHHHWWRTLEGYKGFDPKEGLMNSQRGQFYPCNHKGSCDKAKCSCFAAGINCEKSCGCAALCERRFKGCNCSRNGKVCWKNSKCTCWQMERECDPDLCGKCGAAEALDPRRRDADANAPASRLCGNVSIQRNAPKRTLLGRSRVAGFGLFTGEAVREGDFLGEYKGEILSEPESDRRQILHQHLREYLFVVNRDQQIDSTYAGNKMRFVNNSCKAKNINCNPVPLLCNGVIRMGLYASRNLKAGQELFFNYGYTEKQLANFKEIVENPTIASKTAKPVVKKVETAVPMAEKAKGNDRGQARVGRKPMIAAPAATVDFKRNTRRVIDDSEASSDGYEDDEESDSQEEQESDAARHEHGSGRRNTDKSPLQRRWGGHMASESKSPRGTKRKR